MPGELRFDGGLSASSGSVVEEGGIVSWVGNVPTSAPVTIAFRARVRDEVTASRAIVNRVTIDDGQGTILERQVTIIANGRQVHLPLISVTR